MRVLGMLPLLLWTLSAQQVPNPTQQKSAALTPAETGQPMPIFRVTVVSRTTKAINYHHRTGSTQIDFRGTELMPAARGEAKVESQMGSTKIQTRLEKMTPAGAIRTRIYDLRAVGDHARGRATNLGEVVLRGRSCRPAVHHRSAVLRTDRHRRAVLRGHPAERRGGGGELRPQRHHRHHPAGRCRSSSCCSAVSMYTTAKSTRPSA